MKPLEINLATSPYRNDLPIAVLLAALGLAAVGFTAHNTYAFLTADARTTKLREELAGHRARMEQMKAEAAKIEKELAAIDAEVVGSQAEFVASILAERNFSWTQLFNELERVVPWDVKLISVRPVFDAEGVQIQIQGLARTLDSFFEFQEVLGASESFDDVVPNSYEHPGGPGDQRAQFDMSFAYSPKPAAGGTDGTVIAAAQEGDAPGDGDGGDVEQAEEGEAPPAPDTAEELEAETGLDARRTGGAGGRRDRAAAAASSAPSDVPRSDEPGSRRQAPGAAGPAGDTNADAGMAALPPVGARGQAATAPPTPVDGRTVAPFRQLQRPVAAGPGAPRADRGDLSRQRPTEVTFDEQGRPKVTPRVANPPPPPDSDAPSDSEAPDEGQP